MAELTLSEEAVDAVEAPVDIEQDVEDALTSGELAVVGRSDTFNDITAGILAGVNPDPQVDSFSDEELAKTVARVGAAPDVVAELQTELEKFRNLTTLDTINAASKGAMSSEVAVAEISKVDTILSDPSGLGVFAVLVSNHGKLDETPEMQQILKGIEDAPEKIQIAIANAASEFEKNVIVSAWGGYLLSILSEDGGFLANAANIGGLFIPDRTIELDSLGEKFGIDLSDINTLIGQFEALTPEVRAAITPGIIAFMLENADSNELKVVEQFGKFLAGDFEVGTGVIFDILDASIVAPLASVLAKSVKNGSTIIKVLKKVGNEPLAGRLNAKALTDTKVDAGVRATATSQTTAQLNTLPVNFNADLKILEATDGIAAETVLHIEDGIAVVRAELEAIQTEQLGVRTQPERLAAQAKAIDDFDALAREVGLGKEISKEAKPRIVGERIDGFDLEVTVRRDANGRFSSEGSTRIIPVRYTRDEIGKLDAVTLGPLGTTGKILSPTALFSKLFKDINLVGRATNLDFQSAAAANKLSKIARDSLKGINKEGRGKIDSILLHGDDTARTFNLQELMIEGVPTEGGIHTLNKVEATAYFKQREILDQMFFLKNSEVRNTLVFDDFKTLNVNIQGATADHSAMFVRKVDKEVALAEVKRVYDPELRRLVDITDPSIAAKLTDDTYIVVATKGGKSPVSVSTAGNDGAKATELFTHSLVRETELKGLPDYVLQYREGYVPIVRDGVHFVVRSGVKAPINGTLADVVRTERLFSSRKDATKWVDAQNKLAQKNNDSRTFFKPARNREQGVDELEDGARINFGGMFGSARSKREILFGLDGEVPIRLNAFKALEKNINHVAANGTTNNFRLTMMERLRNTFADDLKDGVDILNTKGAVNPIKGTVDPSRAAAITRIQDYMRDFLRIPSAEERGFEKVLVMISDKLDGAKIFGKPVPDRIRTAFLDVSAVDPIAKMRGLTFHALLGAFNPSGALVQAQGATIAFSLNPLQAPKFLAQYAALRHIAPALRGGVPKEILESVSGAANAAVKGVFGSTDEFAEMAAQFERTGLFNSVRTSADFEATLEGFNVTGGMLKNVADKGLIFFREGELFGRIFSWVSARAEWIAANPGKKIDIIAESEILSRSVDFTLNLNRAAQANWQKGLLSVPLQFKQVTAKFAETMFGLNPAFSKKQRGAIMVGQLALFGAAGVPLGGDWLAKQMLSASGVEFGDLSEAEQAAATGGAWELASELAFGERVSASNRFSLTQGITDSFKAIADPDTGLVEGLLGAFGSVPNRAWQAWNASAPLFVQPTEFEWDLGDVVTAAGEFGRVFSSFNNGHQAYTWWKLQTVVDSKGRKLFPISSGEDMALILTKAMGFQPRRIMDIQNNRQFTRNIADAVRKTTDGLTRNGLNFMKGDMNDPDSIKQFKIRTTMLLVSLPDGELRNRAFKTYMDRMTTTDTEENKTFNRAVNDIIAGGLDVDTSPFTSSPLLSSQASEEAN